MHWLLLPRQRAKASLVSRIYIKKWRLHARIISETSHQVLLSLYLWHARHNLDVIKTHPPDIAELIPHINLGALTSHITSRSS